MNTKQITKINFNEAQSTIAKGNGFCVLTYSRIVQTRKRLDNAPSLRKTSVLQFNLGVKYTPIAEPSQPAWQKHIDSKNVIRATDGGGQYLQLAIGNEGQNLKILSSAWLADGEPCSKKDVFDFLLKKDQCPTKKSGSISLKWANIIKISFNKTQYIE